MSKNYDIDRAEAEFIDYWRAEVKKSNERLLKLATQTVSEISRLREVNAKLVAACKLGLIEYRAASGHEKDDDAVTNELSAAIYEATGIYPSCESSETA